MISILRGNVISQETDGIIVDVNGIGFHVIVPDIFKGSGQGRRCGIFIHKNDHSGRCMALVWI